MEKRYIVIISFAFLFILSALLVYAASYPVRGTINWDVPLHEYLNVVHNDDGTLKDDVVRTNNIVNGTIAGGDLAAAVIPNSQTSTTTTTATISALPITRSSTVFVWVQADITKDGSAGAPTFTLSTANGGTPTITTPTSITYTSLGANTRNSYLAMFVITGVTSNIDIKDTISFSVTDVSVVNSHKIAALALPA